MSNIFISDIVGTGTYAVPSTDVALSGLDQRFYDLIDAGVAGFTMERAIAWVKDSASASGGEGTRTLNCLLAGVVYDSKDCPPEAEADIVFAAIEAALLAAGGNGTITSVGVMEYNMVAYR
jgi:hypothetical protein